MIPIATTRFNQETWNSNKRWRDRNNWEGCIYGSPVIIKKEIPLMIPMFVLEMNNDINNIVGIGLVKNTIEKKQKYKIYEWGNYNRYIYKGKCRIDRENLDKEEIKIIEILDMLLFKGSRHLKRGQGLIMIPKWIETNKHIDFKKKILEMFKTRFKDNEY